MHEHSISLLNKAAADELAAVHQYMYFHFHCDDQGYDLLSALFKRTAIEEMMHVEKPADRILFLKGDVTMEVAAPTKPVQDVAEMLAMACAMEAGSIRDYNLWANECSANADSASRKIFEELVLDEERHFSQFDMERTNLKKYGENYLVLQTIERSKTLAAGAPPA